MPVAVIAPVAHQPPPAVEGVHCCHRFDATRAPLYVGSHTSVVNGPAPGLLGLIGMLMLGAAWSLPIADRSMNVAKARSLMSARRMPPNRWAKTVAWSVVARVVRRR